MSARDHFRLGGNVTSLMDVLGRPACIRVLALLRKRGRARTTEIQETLGLDVDAAAAALKDLRRGLWVVPTTGDDESGGPIAVQYELSHRGLALLEVLDGVREAARRRQRTLGSEAVKDLDALFA